MSNVCENSANDGMKALAGRLDQARSLLVVTHGRPDGDGLGSMAALAAAAGAAGKTVRLFLPDPAPMRYDYLFDQPPTVGADRFAAMASDADLIVIVDTCAIAQLDGLDGLLPRFTDKIVVVDHHATADEIGSLQWIDTSAAAAGVMVTELIDELGWSLDGLAAEALMTAITTDTGWLRFANTDGRCLRAVAELVDAGVRPDTLFRRIYQTDRPERLALLRCVLASLELHCDGRIAAMTIRRTDFATTGARPDETENLVNEALRLASVETAILLVENTDCVRVSLRSRDAVDVSAVARQFGGGGHKRAAGLRAATDVDDLRTQLIAACAARL